MHPPSQHAPLDAAQREVVAVIDTVFAALERRDLARLRSLYAPDARFVSVRYEKGGTEVRQTGVDEFLALIAADPDTLVERIWDPEVRIDRDVAAVWTPYELHRGARWSHCGYNGFHLIRQRGQWQIVAATYTVRRDRGEETDARPGTP